jgi:hypothetical protein
MANAIGVAVERDADVGVVRTTLLLQHAGMGRAAIAVDVEAVGLTASRIDLGAEFPQHGRRDLVGGAVGAIDRRS